MVKKKKYYVINTEQQPQGQLLFWRPNGNGYTTDFTEAGVYDEETANWHNLKGRDVALSKEEFEKLYNVITVTYAEARGFKFLKKLKKQKQKKLSKKDRLKKINDLIKTISQEDNGFFKNKNGTGLIANFQLKDGKIFFQEEWKGECKRISSRMTKLNWIHHGGTICDVILSFTKFIEKGKTRNGGYFTYYWGISIESQIRIHKKAHEIGYLHGDKEFLFYDYSESKEKQIKLSERKEQKMENKEKCFVCQKLFDEKELNEIFGCCKDCKDKKSVTVHEDKINAFEKENKDKFEFCRRLNKTQFLYILKEVVTTK